MSDNAYPYSAETNGIVVSVAPHYLEAQSKPAENAYFWSYQIEIVNNSEQRVQLLNRRWDITDATGACEIVEGAGVVGDQPVLDPGDSYTYSSGCPLRTPSGFMVGKYEMTLDSGERFWIDVPAFALDLPGGNPSLN